MGQPSEPRASSATTKEKEILMDLILNLLGGGVGDFEFYPKGEAHGFFDDWIQTI